MELEKQRQLAQAASTYFDGKLRTIILDNRRRYRMQMKDEAERKKRGLSAIPSTKTTAAVDRYVERSLIEYHQDPDSISFTARAAGDPDKDLFARWLTQLFIYRAENTFDFFNWHQSSLLAGAVDGLECAIVTWRQEAYQEQTLETHYIGPDGTMQPVPRSVYEQYAAMLPEQFHEMPVTKRHVCLDTWWIDQLEPGKDIIWDPNIPLLDVNSGQFCLVKLRKSVQEVKSFAEMGILDPAKVTDEILKRYQNQAANSAFFAISSIGVNSHTYRSDRTIDNPEDVNLEEMNPVELCCFFFKEGNRWMCQFSLGMQEAVSDIRPVDDVWFGGRKVNRLPVVVGTTKLKLWERVGRAIPETIAPIEDEHIDHKNNVNDAAKIGIQGKWWVEDEDLNIDDLLNRRIVRGKLDDGFGQIPTDFGFLNSMRADDARQSEMNELIPAGVMGAARNVAGKGTNRTLGQTQLGVASSDEKLGVQIVTRNNTFLKKVLWLIAQLEMAFETDEVVLKIAGQKAGIDVPTAVTMSGRKLIDVSVLDFNVDIQINAGLGSAPRYQKADTTMQLIDWGKAHGVPVNSIEGFKQLSTLAGYSPEQLLDKEAGPPPPQVEYKLNLSLTLQELLSVAPEAGEVLKQKLISGQMDVSTKVDNPTMNLARQNGGGFVTPDRTGTVVDGTGSEAMAMSEGGQVGGMMSGGGQ